VQLKQLYEAIIDGKAYSRVSSTDPQINRELDTLFQELEAEKQRLHKLFYTPDKLPVKHAKYDCLNIIR
jgi:hypothetical protein